MLTALEYHMKKRHKIKVYNKHVRIYIRGRNTGIENRIILKQILKERNCAGKYRLN